MLNWVRVSAVQDWLESKSIFIFIIYVLISLSGVERSEGNYIFIVIVNFVHYWQTCKLIGNLKIKSSVSCYIFLSDCYTHWRLKYESRHCISGRVNLLRWSSTCKHGCCCCCCCCCYCCCCDGWRRAQSALNSRTAML